MRALAIVHEKDAGPGVFAEGLAETGVELDTWLVPDAAEPPADPASYGAVMTFGGSMNVDQTDRHRWIETEKELLAELAAAGTPLLGACLGAQLLCAALGGEVVRMPDPEIGWHDVELTDAGRMDPIIGSLPERFTGFGWHSYRCEPPEGAEVLATSPACVQAFRMAERVWCIQFHAEVSSRDVNHWIDHYRDDADAVRIGLDAVALRQETQRRIAGWNQLGRSLAARFCEAAAAGVRT
jgi:GMP synthase-like glutamine amidotransferase